MQTRREYLADKGLAIAGARGKFSNAAKEELARAMAAGIKFSDDIEKAAATPRVPRERVPAPAESEYVSPSDYRFPESEYKLLDKSGKPVKNAGMRNVCDTCNYSFVGHLCNTPVLWGSPVQIVKA